MSRPPGHDARDSITASCHGDSSQLSAVKWRDPFSLDGHPLATMPPAKDRTAILALLNGYLYGAGSFRREMDAEGFQLLFLCSPQLLVYLRDSQLIVVFAPTQHPYTLGSASQTNPVAPVKPSLSR